VGGMLSISYQLDVIKGIMQFVTLDYD